jgi:hypothetical protein
MAGQCRPKHDAASLACARPSTICIPRGRAIGISSESTPNEHLPQPINHLIQNDFIPVPRSRPNPPGIRTER